MTVHSFQRSVRLEAPLEAVFAFHLQAANLTRISPPWIRVMDVQCPPVITPGSEVRVRVRVLGILPQYWRVRIQEIEEPVRIVDHALEAPFPYWRHVHEFRAIDGGTEMTDRVEYQPPLGWIGSLLDSCTHRPFLAWLFRYRHLRTRALLESAGERTAATAGRA